MGQIPPPTPTGPALDRGTPQAFSGGLDRRRGKPTIRNKGYQHFGVQELSLGTMADLAPVRRSRERRKDSLETTLVRRVLVFLYW